MFSITVNGTIKAGKEKGSWGLLSGQVLFKLEMGSKQSQAAMETMAEGQNAIVVGTVTATAAKFYTLKVWNAIVIQATDQSLVNQVVCTGRLGRDPEVRSTGKGQSVTNFSLAIGRGDETIWYKVAAWGRTGELCAQYLGKGRLVAISGRLDAPRAWKTQSGDERVDASLTANNVEFLDGGEKKATPAAGPVVARTEESIPF